MSEREAKVTVSDKILAATFLKLLPQKVTPNQITIFRFLTVPFVVFLLVIREYEWGITLFVISAFTDALDGALARTTNRITDWGKTYDPLADKLLIVLTALMVVTRHLGITIVFLIMMIEMILIGSAYYFKNKGVIEIRANGWGKAKMMCQSVGVGLVLLFAVTQIPVLLIAAQFILYASILFAIVSLITYGI